MKVLELYAGIGGVAATGANVVAAIDHDPYAHDTYVANFRHPAHRLNLVSVRAERLRAFDASVWWMSPPCQPFTVRGRRRDVDDRRCESFLALVDRIREIRPEGLCVENVPGFQGSRAHARLLDALEGYAVTEGHWCTTSLGVPMERRRFYLVAARRPVELEIEPSEVAPLSSYLDVDPDPRMRLTPAFLERFEDALHVVDAADPHAVAACFTRAYGNSPVYAGSYLRRDGVLYRFSPGEVARLMGFPDDFCLPDDPSRATKLLGNAVSVDAARWLLRALQRTMTL